MFAPAYMGRKRILQMLSLDVRQFLILSAERWTGLRPSFSAHLRWGEEGAPVQGRGLPCCLQVQPSSALINNYLTVLHHPSDVVDYHIDIAQWIALDRHQISKVSRSNGSELARHAEKGCGIRGGRF
jgi:hypothetical protein